MAIFNIVFFKIISTLLSVVVGLIAGKTSKVERDTIAALLFYFIAPIIFFATPASTSLTLDNLTFIVLIFVMASCLCIISYYFFSYYFHDETRNILALSAGTANVGYYMLPIASALFDEYTLSIYMMSIIGINIYESTVGFFIAVRSVNTIRDSIRKILRLPSLNAFILGCLFSITGLKLPSFLEDFISNMRSTYSILGMIMVGLGISSLTKFEINLKFTLAAFTSKFIFYPVFIHIFIFMDKYITHWYNQSYYNALILLSAAPMAANTIVISSILKYQPHMVASAVLLSCLFVLFYAPLSLIMFLKLPA